MSKVIHLSGKKKHKKRILIVEETGTTKDFFQTSLNNIFELTFKSNITDLLSFIEQETADLIIIDASLTFMNAFNLLKMLKLQNNTKDIPVIFISNLKNGDNVRLGIELGVKDYILSPFDQKDLICKISLALES